MSLASLAKELRGQSGLLAKRDIRPAASVFNHLPFPHLGRSGLLGDDAALLPACYRCSEAVLAAPMQHWQL